VTLLDKHDIPVIEDDVYAELFFGRQRPKPLKAFDRKGLILNCNSFSKSLAPGYRVGWVAAGRFAAQQDAALESLTRHMPADVSIARPTGGYFLWLEMPLGKDAIEIHQLALEQGFSIAPGPIFSARRAFRHCLRLNYGHPWTSAADSAVRALGRILRG